MPKSPPQRVYIFEAPDGSKWAVPVKLIAEDRAAYYAPEFGGDIRRALDDTYRDFTEDPYEIIEWARGNMVWDDVKRLAVRLRPPVAIDMDVAWANPRNAILGEYAPHAPKARPVKMNPRGRKGRR